MKSFKELNSLEKRISEANKIISRYPSHIPIIVECDSRIGTLEKQKFLVPYDVSASHLLFSVRKQINTDSSKAIFMFIEKTIVCPTTMMSTLYENYLNNKKEKDGDKFLYIYLQTENTFGTRL
jgi:GABA(A) receptor-associated protein